MPDFAADDHLRRRALAEGVRQAAHERARSQYEQARSAELTLYRERVQAAKDRMAAAEVPLEFIPPEYQRGSGNEAFDKAFAELDAARKALDALDGAQPSGRDLANQLQAAVDAADKTFNEALQRGFE